LAIIPIAMFLALFVGIILGVIRSMKIPVINQILSLYIITMRGVPTILLMFICYFVLNTGSDPRTAAILALVVSNGAYITEIARGGIEAVDKRQREAAKSLGLNLWQSIYYIIMPQFILLVSPAIVGQLVLLIKATAYASVIGYIELIKMGVNLMQATFLPLPIFFYSAVFYFIACHSLKKIADYIDSNVRMKIMGEKKDY